MIYFKKEILSNGLRDSKGNAVQFETVAGNAGVLALDDKNPLVADLSKMTGSRGLIKISQAQYDELKKKQPSLRQSERSKGPRLFSPEAVIPKSLVKPVPGVTAPASVAHVVVKSPAAIAEAPVEPKPFKPRVGRPKKSK